MTHRRISPLTTALAALLAAVALAPAATAQLVRDPLTGTVLDPDGAPVAGAMVTVYRAGGRGTGLLDLDYKNDFRRVGVARTGKDGTFGLQLPVGLPCRIVVDHPPHARYLREDRLPGMDLTIRLQRPAILTGRILLHDGSPGRAKLRAWHRDTHDEVLRGETDAEGRYRFDRVPPGPIRVDVDPERAPSPRWHDVDLEAGNETVYDVTCEEGHELTGRVVDADTGAPIPGAKVGEGWTFNRAVTSGDDGRFVMHGYGSSGYQELHCLVDGYVKEVRRRDDAAAQKAVEFRMRRGHTTTGRVVDADGAPLADVYVQVFGTVHDGTDQYHSCLATRTAADGTFRLRGLREDLFPVVVARKDGFATVVYALPDAKDGVRAAGDVTLPPPRIVRGVLKDQRGEPIVDTSISIWGHNADLHRLAPDGPLARDVNGNLAGWGMLDMYVGRRASRTNHRGEFVFGDVPAGEWRLVAYGENNRRLGAGPKFVVAPEGPIAPRELVVDR